MSSQHFVHDVAREVYDAVLFDLDGVVTQTARVHAASWKELFDDFLQRRAGKEGVPGRPFDPDRDYRDYVDGKPRYEGVNSFLESRHIFLPYGEPADSEDRETVCALGNRKDVIFREHLRRHGVEVYPAAVSFLNLLREFGFRTAVVSSSRNCEAVLKAGGLEALFDIRIDGVVAGELGLRGKPYPDTFLEAARRLGVEPARAVVLEDALSGVEAGKAGMFGCVIGVDRGNQAAALLDHGADLTISNLGQLEVEGERPIHERDMQRLPSALAVMDDVEGLLSGRRLFVALDYDGTLTPIVERPELAVLSDKMRQVVSSLAEVCTVAVISGRDLTDVRALVGLDNLYYAGSHGFDIAGPAGRAISSQQGGHFLSRLDEAERELNQGLAGIEGVLLERKKFSIAVHYRQVPEDRIREVSRVVDRVLGRFEGLRKGLGKRVFEIQPEIDWNKGKALLWLMETLKMDTASVIPLYVGDDVTDEDAFRAIQPFGLGFVVHEGIQEKSRSSAAQYALENCDQVGEFLGHLTEMLKGGSR